MRTRVTNLSRGARGFHTAAGCTVLLEPGASTVLDLARHPAHDGWIEAGEVSATPEDDPAPPAARARPSPRPGGARGRDA